MFKIVKDSNTSLREKCAIVNEPYEKSDIKLVKDMLDYIKKSQDENYAKKHNIRAGVGLAAPQIGVNKRMIAIYYSIGDQEVTRALINPKIIASSIKECYLTCGEGCLSVDDEHNGYVYRANKITVRAFDVLKNEDVEFVARGYDAIVLQHEIDHLNGILFYDHIDKTNPFKKKDNAIAI